MLFAANVNNVDFADSKKHELMMERKMMQDKNEKIGSTPWRRPPPISDLPEKMADSGHQSTERKTQREREQGVLLALYFNKDM